MNILMISKSEYDSDVRVRREAETLAQAGHRITVIDISPIDRPSADQVTVLGTGPVSGLGPRRPKPDSAIYRVARWCLLPEHRQRALKQFQARVVQRAADIPSTPDVIHAHDYPALEPATTLRSRFGSMLVYDAHEYWAGMPRYGRPEPFRRFRQTTTEHRLARQADRVITVSEAAASLLRKDLGIDDIAVVRNSFPRSPKAGLRPDTPSGLIYAGRIARGRDLDTAFAAEAWDDRFELRVMGPVDGTIHIPDWVRVLEPGDMSEVDQALRDTGISLVPLERRPLNHSVALPNKLFQAVAVGIPVVAANLPEMARLVEKHGLGALYEPGDADSLTRAINTVRDGYAGYSNNIIAAQAELSWDRDAEVLHQLYVSIDESARDS